MSIEYINRIAIMKNTSAMRLTIIAFIAALLAAIRVNQKLVSRYEHNPTPSQPINIWTKFEDVTENSVKSVESDK